MRWKNRGNTGSDRRKGRLTRTGGGWGTQEDRTTTVREKFCLLWGEITVPWWEIRAQKKHKCTDTQFKRRALKIYMLCKSQCAPGWGSCISTPTDTLLVLVFFLKGFVDGGGGVLPSESHSLGWGSGWACRWQPLRDRYNPDTTVVSMTCCSVKTNINRREKSINGRMLCCYILHTPRWGGGAALLTLVMQKYET